jgi:microcystin-dependent protein
MKYAFKKELSCAVLMSSFALAVWSPSSYACSTEPILASVCIMATPASYGNFNNQYVLAAGQQMQINQNAALYSLIGVTYGGDARVTFNLPDLRGRVIIGSNTSGTYPSGKTGGAEKINLTVSQLPPHNFQVLSNVDLSKVTAATTLASLTATANLGGVKVSGPATGLVINANSANGGNAIPTNNYLGKANTALNGSYSTVAPDVQLNAGSIGGNLSLTIANGTSAPVNISGSATTVIGGSATAAGTSNTLGLGADVPILQPYLAMTYYIAANNSIYPSRD